MKTCFCGFMVLLFLSCGEVPEESAAGPSALSCDTLAVVCEIGELMGDSLYVFGEITSAEPVPEGVAVLDVRTCRISFYNREGLFTRSVGGHGEGPGEFLLPIDFAVLADGRIAVADLMSRRIDILSSNGELLNSLSTDRQILPYRMDTVSDSTFFVYYYTTQRNEEKAELGFQLEVWNTSGFQAELWSYREEFNGSDFKFAPGYIQCCAAPGGVYISQMDDSDFAVHKYSILQPPALFIDCESEEVPADSADVGYDQMYVWVSMMNGDQVVELESEPLEFRPQTGAMGLDSQERLWIRKGTTDSEEWLIYSSTGELVSNGTVTGISDSGRLRYVINEYGAVAWAPHTEDYPVLYLLSGE